MNNITDQESVRLLAVGDIMLGDSPYCFGHGVGSMIKRHGPISPFDHVKDILCAADLTIGNLEIVISAHDRKKDPFESLEYRAQPNAAEGLAQAGFDLLSLATNHTMEHGRKALEESLDLLDKNKIKYSGIVLPEKSLNNRCFIEKKKLRFCFLNYNFRPEQYFLDPPLWNTPDLQLIQREISEVRDQSDFIIVSLHWGDEFITAPSPEQVVLGRAIIDAGANIILGHHSHIVQGVEKYNGGLIAYSLGNFVFDMWQKRLRKSMILDIRISSSGKINYDIIPVLLNRRHQPVILTGEDGNILKSELQNLSERICNIDKESYDKELSINLSEFRKEIYRYYLRNIFRYNPKFLFANFMGALRKRV